MLDKLRVPIVAAPMAGGPSTPELAAAVTESGGCGFLAAGYLTPDGLAEQLSKTRRLTTQPFGVNLFVPGADSGAQTSSYVTRLRTEADQYGTQLGTATWDDDHYGAKLDLVVTEQVPVVSFTFGLPKQADVARVREAGARVVVTVTTPDEARLGAGVGADALCVQGIEAGGHRGGFADDPAREAGGEPYGLLALLRLMLLDPDTAALPLIAAGGLVSGSDVAAALVAGASAAQLGTAFLRADEAGTPPAQRAALADGGRPTAVTRAFSGRPARGLVNRFLVEHSPHAPVAYPQVHHLTKPIRAGAGKAGDPEAMSLWAGQTYPAAEAGPAADIVARVWEQARSALRRTSGWLRGEPH